MICFPLCYILWVSDLVADWMIRKMIFSLSFTPDLSQFQIEREDCIMNSYIILRPQGPDGVLAETTVFRELGQRKTKENNPSYNGTKEISQNEIIR